MDFSCPFVCTFVSCLFLLTSETSINSLLDIVFFSSSVTFIINFSRHKSNRSFASPMTLLLLTTALYLAFFTVGPRPSHTLIAMRRFEIVSCNIWVFPVCKRFRPFILRRTSISPLMYLFYPIILLLENFYSFVFKS